MTIDGKEYPVVLTQSSKFKSIKAYEWDVSGYVIDFDALILKSERHDYSVMRPDQVIEMDNDSNSPSMLNLYEMVPISQAAFIGLVLGGGTLAVLLIIGIIIYLACKRCPSAP